MKYRNYTIKIKRTPGVYVYAQIFRPNKVRIQPTGHAIDSNPVVAEAKEIVDQDIAKLASGEDFAPCFTCKHALWAVNPDLSYNLKDATVFKGCKQNSLIDDYNRNSACPLLCSKRASRIR